MALVEVVVNRPLTLLTPSLPTMALLTLPLLASACGLPDVPDPVLLPSGDPTRPDIVLLSVDTLRADHLSSYGHSRPTSPFIDSLAAQGQRYTQARSASPWTLPAHTSMMTGQLPTTHLVVDDSLALDPQTRVLPELLSAAGFHTGGFVSTLYVSRVFGFDRGFERFEDFDLHTEKKNLSGQVTMDRVVREALQWWAGLPSGAPVFLFLHTYDAHYAYDPPGAYSRHFDRAPEKGDPKYKNYHHFKKNPLSDEQLEHQRAQYDESIRWIDDQLRWLAESAAISGRQVRFVITSDHGEEFGERGSWGHAHTLYAEQLHIPLIMSGPGLSAQVIDTPVGTQDIAPTLLRWAGVTSGLSADGVDLGPIAAGAPLDRAFPAETTRFSTARLGLREGDLRLEWDLRSGEAELFDLAEDSAERINLAPQRPAEVQALQRRLEQTLGHPWQAEEEGRIAVKDGVVLMDGLQGASVKVKAGDQFLVVPFDAALRFTRRGETVGPFQATGGARPGPGACLRYAGLSGGGSTALTDEQRKMLVELGYMQPDEEAPAAPSPAADPSAAAAAPCQPLTAPAAPAAPAPAAPTP
jgi:arylsulfatase